MRQMTTVAVALSIVCVLGAGAGARAPRAATARCGAAASALTAQDLRYAREYFRLVAANAAAVWPGWKRVPPLLQRKGRCEYLIGHPSAPRSFDRVTGTRVLGRTVLAAPAGTITPGVVASTWKVGSTWVAMVPARGDFQQALDRQLGRGTVRLSDTTYVRSVVHEAFHAHQMAVTRGSPPSFGSTIDERQAVELLARRGDAEARLADEGRALEDALTAPSLRGVRGGVEAFVHRRAERRSRTGSPDQLGALEREIEWMEGVARYADLRLLLLAGGPGSVPTKGIRYTPAAAYRRAFLRELADPDPRADGLRGRWQSLGAAEGMVLDRLVLGWREAVLPRRETPEDLLVEAGGVPTPLADLRVARISVAGRRLGVALAERPEQWQAGLAGVSDLDSLDGMLFAFDKDVSTQFWMKGALIPLDVAFFSSEGTLLRVETMPLCTANPCPTYGSPRPFRFALELPAGTLPGLLHGAKLVVPNVP